MFVTTLALYGALVLYLFTRGVEWRLVARIVAVGAVGGVLSGLIVAKLAGDRPSLAGPFAMGVVLIAAAYYARAQILGAITPLGVILLNVAANLAPGDSIMPLNFGLLASLLPIPYGPVRVVLNLVILYSPALAALFLLFKGPPGNPVLRYVLGVWVCWVGIATVSGPGWEMIDDLYADKLIDWAAAAIFAYAALHVTMLVLNFFISIVVERVGGASIARSIRVDRMNPALALALGLAFGGAAYLWLGLEADDDFKASALITAAFALGAAFAHGAVRTDRAEDAGLHAASLPKLGLAMYFAAGISVLVYWKWGDTPMKNRVRIDPATGMLATQNQVARKHSALEELFHVPLKDWERDDWEKVRWLGIDFQAQNRIRYGTHGALSPPMDWIAIFVSPFDRQRFVSWLEKRGVKWWMSSYDGLDIVEWRGRQNDLLEQYVVEMQRECRDAPRERKPC